MSRALIRRPTGLGLALAAAASAQLGIDVDPSVLPQKREATWSVTRRDKRPKRK
jgi:hypothetical protein